MVFARKIPEDFIEERFRLHPLGRQQGIPFAEVNGVVFCEARYGIDTRPILFQNTFRKDTVDEVQIFSH